MARDPDGERQMKPQMNTDRHRYSSLLIAPLAGSTIRVHLCLSVVAC
jgi:hypothetical protein